MAWKCQIPLPMGRAPCSKHSKHKFENMVLIPVSGLRNPVRDKRGVLCVQGLPFALGTSTSWHLAEHEI